MTDDDVLFERRGPRGRLGVITLNRPRKLNTLTHEMLVRIAQRLAEWRCEPDLEQVVLVGAGERGLCAGGDVAAVRTLALSGRSADDYFADEYRLDASMAEYPKPIVPIMDGFVFGGGIGLAGHVRDFRLVTERSQLAMPETAIGFVPDVGGTWLLARMPGELGLHAGLTGARIGPGDALATGFADHVVDSSDLPALIARLEDEPAAEVVAAFAQTAPAAPLLAQRQWIDRAYSGATLGEIVDGVRKAAEAGEPGAADAQDALGQMSPTSLAATLALIRRSRSAADLRTAIDLEFRVGMRLVDGDFLDGVRAKLIDKDGRPHWNPPRIADLDPRLGDRLLDPEGGAVIDWAHGPL